MNYKINRNVLAILTVATLLGNNCLIANASSGTTTTSSSQTTTSTTQPVITTSQPSTAPWIGNLTATPNPFDVSGNNGIDLKFDYKNIPANEALPTIIIYKDGDVSKTDLKKNYVHQCLYSFFLHMIFDHANSCLLLFMSYALVWVYSHVVHP